MTDKSWMKAVVIGSIWASLEIIFGNFFHSLRLPFAGTFLTFMSIVLLSAFATKWKEKNLFLKAGLIAALIRSMVPTSVILGPFIGIMTEALIFQLMVNLFGKNFFSFAMAGILSMFSAIIHKVISIIIIYGWDIVKILERLYFIFLKSTHLDLPPAVLFKIVLITYSAAGILAAWIGISTARKTTGNMETLTNFFPATKKDSYTFQLTDFSYKPTLIYVHLLTLIAGFILLTYSGLFYFIPFFVFYEIFLIYRYGKLLRKLGKWMFWFQLFLVLIISVLIWPDKKYGLIAGLQMIFRAVWMVSLFVAISIELKNPLVKALLTRKGFGKLYEGLQLATNILPGILNYLSQEKKLWLNPLKVLQSALIISDQLLRDISLRQANVLLIHGETSGGKTSFLKKLQTALAKEPFTVGGIIAEALIEDNAKSAYYIKNLKDNKSYLLCDRKPGKNKLSAGRFYFYPASIEEGNRILKQAGNADIIIIDEVGPLEAQKEGWYPALDYLINKKKLMIWSAKSKLIPVLQKQFPRAKFHLFDINKHSPDEIIRFIKGFLENK